MITTLKEIYKSVGQSFGTARIGRYSEIFPWRHLSYWGFQKLKNLSQTNRTKQSVWAHLLWFFKNACVSRCLLFKVIKFFIFLIWQLFSGPFHVSSITHRSAKVENENTTHGASRDGGSPPKKRLQVKKPSSRNTNSGKTYKHTWGGGNEP